MHGRQLFLLLARQTEFAGDFRILEGARTGDLQSDLTQPRLLAAVENLRDSRPELFVDALGNLGKLRPHLA